MKENNIAGTSVPALDDVYMLSSCGCVKRYQTFGIITGLLIMAVGVVLMFIPEMGYVTDKNYTSGVSMAGLMLLLYGIYFAIAKCKRMVTAATGSPVKRVRTYYDPSEMKQVKDFLDGKTGSLPASRSQGGVYLNAFVAKDASLACVQLSMYKDLAYEPVMAPVILKDERVCLLTNSL